MARLFGFTKPAPTEKPPIGVNLKRGHPLNNNILVCSTFAEGGGVAPINKAGGLGVSVVSTGMGYSIGRYGMAATRTTSNATSYFAYSTATNFLQFAATQAFSIELLVFIPGLSAANFLWGCLDSGSLNGYFVEVTTTGGVRFNLRGPTNGQLVDVISTTLLTTGNWYSVVVTYDGSTTAPGVSIYINGVKSGQTNTANNYTGTIVYTVSLRLGVGGSPTAVAGLSGTSFAKASIWGRVLTAAEAQLLYAQPFCHFESSANLAYAAAITNPAPTTTSATFFPFFDI